MPTYLAFGDSNTHGTMPQVPPRSFYERHPVGVRWPTVAFEALPHDWHLAEEGLPGRTTRYPDPIMGAHMEGWLGFRIALMTHAPVELVTIMLGTNDVKTRLGATPEAITAGIAGLLDILREPEMIDRTGQPKVLVIAPPPVDVQDDRAAEWQGSTEKSRSLAALYAEIAAGYDVEFLDAAQHISVEPGEGIHFEAEAHRTLGAAVGVRLRAMVG